MSKRSSEVFTTVKVEGSILPPDLLLRVAEGDPGLKGLAPQDYHLAPNEKLNEATNRAWNRLVGLWASFCSASEQLPAGDPGIGVTRQRWLLPLMQELGFGNLSPSPAKKLGEREYPISHSWRNVPIHFVGRGVDLDTRTERVAGAATRSPHSLLQEFLNASDKHLWGIVSNGLRLRVLRDNSSLTRQAYVEFDLQAMMDGEVYSDFVLLWLVCHASRFEAEKLEDMWIERWSRAAQEQGVRFLNRLSAGVEEAVSALGRGFIAHPSNSELREKLKTGGLDRQDYFKQILRIVYRLIFLFVAEDRDVLHYPDADRKAREIYHRYYSLTKLRRLADRTRGTKHCDLYQGFRLVMRLLRSDEGAPALGLPALGGSLFSAESVADIGDCEMSNRDFLTAIRSLAFTVDKSTRRAVDYRNMGAEELGSVYESLLELVPEMNVDAGTFTLRSFAGNERKTTGSYYTPESLIQCLLDSALDPVLDDAVRKPDPENALLSLAICDPACGSGHFLIGAAHRIAKRLAAIRTGDEEPSPEAIRRAMREVIGRCIYGVDLNEMAVELCKVALWMESVEPGKPLSFLKHRIAHGNSLVGMMPSLEGEPIPAGAYKPLSSDDKSAASEARRHNDQALKSEQAKAAMSLFYADRRIRSAYSRIAAMPDDSPERLRAKEQAWSDYRNSNSYKRDKLAADLWCAPFFWTYGQDGDAPTTAAVFDTLRESMVAAPAAVRRKAEEIARDVRFFHWQIEFPDVFRNGGFDCVLGNPPWERIKLQEQEFFAARDPEIANAPNKAARERLIKSLPKTNPMLAKEWDRAKHDAEAQSKFVRESGRAPLTAVGDVNTYALFSEQFVKLLSPRGRSGIICPTGIATDNTTKAFFDDLVTRGCLVSLFGFENEEFIFPGVHHAFRFCALTVAGESGHVEAADLVFLCRSVSDVNDRTRHFLLTPEDISLLNPNTRTCPVFRTQQDAELTKAIYRRVPVLVNEVAGQDPWGVSFLAMLHMANDSGLFCTRDQLEVQGLSLVGNQFQRGNDIYLPLYEAKMMHQFDHRYSTYEGATQANLNAGILPQTTPEQKADPEFAVQPRYWVDRWEVMSRVSDVPRDLLIQYRLKNEKAIRKIIMQWLAGYHLNRADLGNADSSAIGEDLVQKMSGSGFQSVASDAMDYWTNQAAFRSMEQEHHLTQRDLDVIQRYARREDAVGMAESLIWSRTPKWLLAFRGITGGTVYRTSIFSILPLVALGHSAFVLFPRLDTGEESLVLLGAFCSLVLDCIVRQKISGNMTMSCVRQFPLPTPGGLDGVAREFLVPRLLELVYTSFDLEELAASVRTSVPRDVGGAIARQWEENKAATGGHEWNPPEWAEIAEDGITLPPFKWDEDRRAVLRAELDAYYAKLYGLNRKQLRYILDPHGLSKKELEDILSDWEDPTCSGPHLLPTEPDLDFPGETFRVLKEKEEKKFGEYRTRRLVLEAWERLHAQGLMPEPYDQRNDPATQYTANDGGQPDDGTSSSADAVHEAKTLYTPRPVPSARNRAAVPTPNPTPPKHPVDPSQQTLLDVTPTTPTMSVPTAVPGETRVTVNGEPGTALSCEQISLGARQALRWTVVMDSDGSERKFYSPPAKVEVKE